MADLTPQQRRDRPLAVQLIVKSLTVQCGTQTVERYLGELRLAELKHRARALGGETLESSITSSSTCRIFCGRQAGKAFNPDSLFRSAACQNAYRRLYGENKTPAKVFFRQVPEVQRANPSSFVCVSLLDLRWKL